MINLFGYLLRGGWWWTALIIIMYVGNYLLKFTTYRGISKLIDGLGADGMENYDPTNQLLMVFGKLMLIHLVGSILHHGLQRIISTRLRFVFIDLIKRLPTYDSSFYTTFGRDKIQEVWHYLANMGTLISCIIMEAPTSLVYLIYYSYTILSFSPFLFLGVMVINGMIIRLIYHWHQKQIQINREKMIADLETKSRYNDGIACIDRIKSSGTELVETERILTSYDRYYELKNRDKKLSLFTTTTSYMINDVLMMTIYLFGTRMVIGHQISSLDLMYLAVHTGNFFHKITEIWGYYSDYQKLSPKINQLFKMINYDRVEELDSGTELPAQPTIQFKNLGFGYTADRILFSDCNIRFVPNRINILMGPNGSGKSTLMKLLTGYYYGYSGEILLNNKRMEEYSVRSIRDQICYIHQEPLLFNETVEYNLLYGLKNKQIGMAKLPAVAKLLSISEWLKENMDKKTGENGANLSGGEKKRLQLANGLLRDSSVMIFDEPTNALDTETVGWLIRLFKNRRIWDQKTVIIITHDQRLLSVADNLVQFEDVAKC